jgi:hypothetical protein
VRSLRDIPVTLGPDGLYHAKVTVGHKANGQLDRRHRSGQTEREVRNKLRELFRKLDSGTAHKAGRAPTVAEWFDHWLTEIAPHGRRSLAPATLNGYRSKCRNWIFPHLGQWRIDALDTEDLDALYKAMRKARHGRGAHAPGPRHPPARPGRRPAARQGAPQRRRR